MSISRLSNHSVLRPDRSPTLARKCSPSQETESTPEPKDSVQLGLRSSEPSPPTLRSMKAMQKGAASMGLEDPLAAPTQALRERIKGVTDILLGPVRELSQRVTEKIGQHKENQIQDRAKELSRLEEGSKKTSTLKSGAHIRGVGVDHEFQSEIERRDGKYYVSSTIAQTGTVRKGDGKAGAGVKVKTEYAFDTPEEAARAERLIQEQIAESSQSVVKFESEAEKEAKRKKYELLTHNQSSTTISGQGAAEYAKTLGLHLGKGKAFEVALSGVNGTGRVGQEVELKVNYQKDPAGGPSRPSELELSTSTNLDLEGDLQPGAKIQQKTQGAQDGGPELGGNLKVPRGKANGKLTFGTKIPLPEGFNAGDLLSDPAKFRDQIHEMQQNAKNTITVQGQYEHPVTDPKDPRKTGQILVSEFESTGDPAQDANISNQLLRNPGVAPTPVEGRLTVRRDTYEKRGQDSGFGVDIWVAGYEYQHEETETRITSRETLVEGQPQKLVPL